MVKFDSVTTKTHFSEVQFYRVEKKEGDRVQLKNLSGENIVVDKKYVENCLISSDQFSSTEKKTRTEMSQILLANANTVFTASFQKKVEAANVTKEVLDAIQNSTPKELEAKVKKAVSKAVDGEERVIVGMHSGNFDEFGRLKVVDLEVTSGHNQRLLDPRGLNWLIVRGIKYVQK